jgi:hypothetical protein
MLRLLLALCLALLLSTCLLWQRNSSLKAEEARLRLSVQALEISAARNSRANAVHKKLLATAHEAEVKASVVMEQALVASPDWAATLVPQEVQDAP